LAQPREKPPRQSKHPSGDRRFDMLDASMKKQKYAPDALIEILHTAQELFGRLAPDILHYVARALKLPPSRVYGVATFYHLFSFTPPGRHTCVVCTGTACYVKGADAMLARLEQALGVPAGRTSDDGEVSVSTARCLGACGLAPIVVYDGEVAAHQTVETALVAVNPWGNHGPR
jgi:bidirectional [NiFe] hydrogenase diaphorase subunit